MSDNFLISQVFRERKRSQTALRFVLSAAVGWVAFTPFCSLAVPQEFSAEKVSAVVTAPDDKKVAVEPVDFANIPRLLPTSTGKDAATQLRLLRERITAPPRERARRVGPDGKRETMESLYWRTNPYPNIVFNSGTTFSPDSGFPPGAISVSGTRPRFGPDKNQPAGTDNLWRWEVPLALRDAHMIGPSGLSDRTDVRFRPLVLVNKSARHLALFDAEKGVVWEKDITALVEQPISGADASTGGITSSYGVVDIACSEDGAYTLVILSTGTATTEVGTRLLVFDHSGKLISQREMAGVTAFALHRNSSRNSFLLNVSVSFLDGKPFEGKPTSVSLFLRRDGSVAGLLCKEDGSFVADSLIVSGDDKIAVASPGLVFTLP